MNKNLLYILFTLLGVMALVFGYLIYQQSSPETTETRTVAPGSVTDRQTQPTIVEPTTEEVLVFPDENATDAEQQRHICLLYTSPSPRDRTRSRMPSSA